MVIETKNKILNGKLFEMKNVFNKIVWGLMGIIILCACNPNPKEKESDSVFSDIVKELTGTVVIGEEYLQDPWTIQIMDSLLIIGNSKGSPLVEIYNRFSKELICSFLTTGEGPLEVLALSQLQNNDEKLFITDLFSKKILSVDKNNIDKDTVIVKPLFSLNGYDEEIIGIVTKIAYLNNKYNIASTCDNRGRLGLINKEDKTIKFFYPYTASEVLFSELDSYTNNNLFSFDMAVGQQNNRIALSHS